MLTKHSVGSTQKQKNKEPPAVGALQRVLEREKEREKNNAGKERVRQNANLLASSPEENSGTVVSQLAGCTTL